MSAMAFQIIGVSIVYSTICSGADQRKHQSSASLVFVRRIHWRPADSPHKGPVKRKIFPFDDVIWTYTVDTIHWDSSVENLLAFSSRADTCHGARATYGRPRSKRRGSSYPTHNTLSRAHLITSVAGIKTHDNIDSQWPVANEQRGHRQIQCVTKSDRIKWGVSIE